MRNILNKAIRVTWPGELGRSAGMEDKFVIDYFKEKKGGYLLDIATACPVSGSLTIKLLDQYDCLLYTSPSPRDRQKSRMPSSA